MLLDELSGATANFLGRCTDHAQGGNFVQRAALVGFEGRFERRDGELVDTQRAEERIAPDALHNFLPSRDDSRLRPAEQLVAAEGNYRGPRGTALRARAAR